MTAKGKEMTQTEKDLEKALHDILYAWNLMYYTGVKRCERRDMNDFSLLELHLIHYIADNGGSIPLVRIREHIDIPNSTLTSLVKRMEAHKVLTREKDPSDNRVYILTLTEFGKEINEQHMTIDSQIAKVFIERVGNEEEIETFLKVVHKAASTPFIPR